MIKLLAGASIQSAVESLRLPLALESVYHLLGRLRRRLDALRCWLYQCQEIPTSSRTDPLLHTFEHLQKVFAQADCPVSEFQVVFQQPFLG